MKYPFKRESEDGLIIVTLTFDGKHEFDMMVDTGASHTTIDSNVLYQIDYNLNNAAGVVPVETANGIIEVEIFEVGSVSTLGLTREHFPVHVYDFLAHGILSDYDGVLGLDFFERTKFCIDMIENTITMSPAGAGL
jgi:predicted aspartyl protease